MRQEELVLTATLAEVARVTQQLRGLLPEWLDAAERALVEIALAEALTNNVEHGHGGDCSDTVRLRLFERPGALEVDLWDSGRPIPVGRLDQADAATTFQFDPTDLAALPEGGMGLALIKSAFQEVRYRRRDGVNWLHLVRRL